MSIYTIVTDEQNSWLQDHVRRYLATDGADGYWADFTAVGGPATPVPESALTIDAQGLDIWPGLIDAGTPLGLVEIGSLPETHDEADSARFQPELHAIRPHPGQVVSAANIYRLLQDSQIMDSHRADLTHAVREWVPCCSRPRRSSDGRWARFA